MRLHLWGRASALGQMCILFSQDPLELLPRHVHLGQTGGALCGVGHILRCLKLGAREAWVIPSLKFTVPTLGS